MKSQKSIMKSKTTKANKNSRRRRGNNRIGRRGGSSASAPAAVSDYLQQYVTFSGTRKGGALSVSALIPICQISSNAHDGTDVIFGSLYANGDQWQSLCLSSTTMLNNPVGSAETIVPYTSPVFELLGSAFVRYHITQCEFCYESQSPTTISDRLVFSFAEDPEHPLVVVDTTVDPNTQDNLLALSDSVAFAPWRSWTLDVSDQIKQDLLYNWQDNDQNTNRFTFFGSMGCLASVEPTAETSPVVYGILYARFTFEFLEFCPIVRGITSSIFQRRAVKAGWSKSCSDVTCKRCTVPCLKCVSKDVHEEDKDLGKSTNLTKRSAAVRSTRH